MCERVQELLLGATPSHLDTVPRPLRLHRERLPIDHQCAGEGLAVYLIGDRVDRPAQPLQVDRLEVGSRLRSPEEGEGAGEDRGEAIPSGRVGMLDAVVNVDHQPTRGAAMVKIPSPDPSAAPSAA